MLQNLSLSAIEFHSLLAPLVKPDLKLQDLGLQLASSGAVFRIGLDDRLIQIMEA